MTQHTLTVEEVKERVRKRREEKAIKEKIKGVKFPVDISPNRYSGMDVFNDLTSGIQSIANPPLRLAARAEQGLTGTNYFGNVLEKQQESVARGRDLRSDENWMWRSGGYPLGDLGGELFGGIALTKGQGVAPTVTGRLLQTTANSAALAPAFAPMSEETLPAMNTGAKYGLLLGPAFEVGGKAVTTLGPPLRGVFSGTKSRASRILKGILGEEEIAVKEALRNTRSKVPGERLTAGEAAASSGSSAMASAQKIIEESSPQASSKYAAIDSANKAARAAEIQRHGGNIVDMKGARDAATGVMRESALGAAAPIQTKGFIAELNKKLNDKTISSVARKALLAIKQEILFRKNKGGTINPDALYAVRKEIGTTLESIYAKEGIKWNKSSAGHVQSEVQQLIDDAIESSGGVGWKNYLETYAEMSKPIDSAVAANKLVNTLRSPLGGERGANFANASKKVKVKDPELQASIDAVEESLRRKADYERLAKTGITETRHALGAPKLPSPGFFSPMYQVFKSTVNHLSGKATTGVYKELVDAFDDPQKVLALLNKTDLPGPIQQTLYKLSLEASAASATGLATKYKEGRLY